MSPKRFINFEDKMLFSKQYLQNANKSLYLQTAEKILKNLKGMKVKYTISFILTPGLLLSPYTIFTGPGWVSIDFFHPEDGTSGIVTEKLPKTDKEVLPHILQCGISCSVVVSTSDTWVCQQTDLKRILVLDQNCKNEQLFILFYCKYKEHLVNIIYVWINSIRHWHYENTKQT